MGDDGWDEPWGIDGKRMIGETPRRWRRNERSSQESDIGRRVRVRK